MWGVPNFLPLFPPYKIWIGTLISTYKKKKIFVESNETKKTNNYIIKYYILFDALTFMCLPFLINAIII